MRMQHRFGITCCACALLLLAGCKDPNTAANAVPPLQPQAAAGGNAPGQADVKVVKWEPRSAVVGKGFNVQANGNSALWFDAPGIGPGGPFELQFGDKSVENVVITPNKGGSVELPKNLLEKPGQYQLALVAKGSGKRYELGPFELKSPQ